jgi:hypothetical protein
VVRLGCARRDGNNPVRALRGEDPVWKRLSKWAFYFGVTALLSRGPGRPWTFAWIFGLPGVGLAFHLWWCKKHGVNPLTAEPKERYYDLRGWGPP